MARFTVLAAIALSCAVSVRGGHGREYDHPPPHLPTFVSGTLLLNDRHFKKHHEKHRPFLALYYASNIDECRAFLNEWRDAVVELDQEFGAATVLNRLVAIDCNRQDSQELCKDFNWHRCPTLKSFEVITPHKAPHHFIREMLEGDGYTRTKEGIIRFVHDHPGLMRKPDSDDDSVQASMYDLGEDEELNLDAMREEEFDDEEEDGEKDDGHSEL